MRLVLLMVALTGLLACVTRPSSNPRSAQERYDLDPADEQTGDSDGADADETDEEATDSDPPPLEPTDFTASGPHEVSAFSSTIDVGDCELEYTLYEPATRSSDVLVILGHGFARSQENMGGIAAHVASYGVRVATPSYCSPFLPDHAFNAECSAALADAIDPGAKVVYAGHSAGALSALLAAAADLDSVGLLGLDLTDANTLGGGAASEIATPSFGVFGEASSCNASGNGVTAMDEITEGTLVRLVNATHCDFEDPSDLACALLCGEASDSNLVLVRALAAAYVAWRTDIDVTGAAWVTSGGSVLEALVAEGKVVYLGQQP